MRGRVHAHSATRAMAARPPAGLCPSWIYVFGVATLAALLFVLASGVVLASGLPVVAHVRGRPLRQLAASVECRAVLCLHGDSPVGQVLHGRVAGNRALTWITGAVAFIGSIGTAFTGYLSQSNFDSQWIRPSQRRGQLGWGRRAIHVLNPAQMLLWHIMLMPLLVGFLVVAHIVLVRRHGVVPPFDAIPPDEPELGISPKGVPAPPAQASA